MKILLVEDDLQLQRCLEAHLSQRGFDVRVADNGKRALSQVDQFDPDWVLTDLLMPDMDGLETIIALRRKNSRARIIAMSGGDWKCADQCMESALRFGAEAYLVKPFAIHELLGILADS